MLLLAYALFAAVVIWAGRRGVGPPGAPARLYALAVGAGGVALGLGILVDEAAGRGHVDAVGLLLLLGSLAGGGLVLALGAAWWAGDVARRLREVGFAALSAALLVPSTLTLALPLAGPAVLALRSVRRPR